MRVCDACHTFESRQLPMLLAGDVWAKPSWTGLRHLRFVWLDADQSALLWAKWDEESATADRQRPRRLELSLADGAGETAAPALAVHNGTGERLLVLEPAGVYGGTRQLQVRGEVHRRPHLVFAVLSPLVVGRDDSPPHRRAFIYFSFAFF